MFERKSCCAAIAAAVALVFMAQTASSDPGDTLFVQGDGVNVRSGPSTEDDVILQVDKGRQLMEISRLGEWVQVGVLRTGGETGWIHVSLAGPDRPAETTPIPDSPAFAKFRSAVEILNEKVVSQIGQPFFVEIEDLGDGIVQLTATDIWISAPKSDRQSNLETLFNLWDAADGTGLPNMVRIVDIRGAVVMQKSRW